MLNDTNLTLFMPAEGHAFGRVAQTYYRLGYSPIPIKPGTKTPHVRFGAYIHARPSPDDIGAWAIEFPDADVALLTGRAHGTFVLDIDLAKGGDEYLAQVGESAVGLSSGGPVVRTAGTEGGHGLHLYMHHPHFDLPGTNGIRKGIDIKADGGYVVAPPSRGITGLGYRFEVPICPVTDLPGLAVAVVDLVLDLQQSRQLHLKTRGARNAKGGAASTLASAPEGAGLFAEMWETLGVHLIPGENKYACPLHDDNDPSLSVNTEKLVWHCHGCQEGGGLKDLQRIAGAVSGSDRTTLSDIVAPSDPDIRLWCPSPKRLFLQGRTSQQGSVRIVPCERPICPQCDLRWRSHRLQLWTARLGSVPAVYVSVVAEEDWDTLYKGFSRHGVSYLRIPSGVGSAIVFSTAAIGTQVIDVEVTLRQAVMALKRRGGRCGGKLPSASPDWRYRKEKKDFVSLLVRNRRQFERYAREQGLVVREADGRVAEVKMPPVGTPEWTLVALNLGLAVSPPDDPSRLPRRRAGDRLEETLVGPHS